MKEYAVLVVKDRLYIALTHPRFRETTFTLFVCCVCVCKTYKLFTKGINCPRLLQQSRDTLWMALPVHVATMWLHLH